MAGFFSARSLVQLTGFAADFPIPHAYNTASLIQSRRRVNEEEVGMDVRAAVAFEAGKPLEVTKVQLEGPKAGEVLVEIKATGICHTDEFTRSGADPEGLVPGDPRP